MVVSFAQINVQLENERVIAKQLLKDGKKE